jgi:FdhD protein
MWTPTDHPSGAAGFTPEDGLLGPPEAPDALALAAGFLLGEGFIRTVNDLKALGRCPDDPKVISVHLRAPSEARARRRDGVISSSCGLCGDATPPRRPPTIASRPGGDLRISRTVLIRLSEDLRRRQGVFAATGGAHAAALFSPTHELLATAEDLGRHNALDKVIGRALLSGTDLGRCGVLLTSRLSFEMVRKAAFAGLPFVGGFSAPTSMAINLARDNGMTLCGFIRESGFTAYTGFHRLI